MPFLGRFQITDLSGQVELAEQLPHGLLGLSAFQLRQPLGQCGMSAWENVFLF